MVPLFGDGSLVDHDDLIRIAHGREPVGHHDGGAVADEIFQGVLDQALGFGVDIRGRFVEHEDRWVGVERPGKGAELAFPSGERHPALHDHLTPAVFKPAEKRADVRDAHRFVPPRLVEGSAERQVLLNGAGEEKHLLHDHRHPAAQFSVGNGPQVRAVDRDAAFLPRVKTPEQIDDGGLARPGFAHDGERGTGRHRERHPAQHPLARRVGGPNVLKGDFAPEARRTSLAGGGGRRSIDLPHRVRLEHGQDLLPGRIGALHDVEFFRQVAERLEEIRDIGEEHDDDAVGDRGMDDRLAADEDDGGDHGPAEEVDKRPENREHGELLDIRVVHAVVDGREFRELRRLAPEYLNDPHAGDILVEKSVEMRDPGADEPVRVARLGPENDGDDGQERKRGRDRERQLHIG